MNRDLTGFSVENFYQDMSGGVYGITGDVLGWVKVPHSVWWYGADTCPGWHSGPLSVANNGGIPNAGNVEKPGARRGNSGQGGESEFQLGGL